MSETKTPRLYGGWRPTVGFGIGQWSPTQSVVLLVSIALPAALLYINLRAALVAAAIGVVVLAVTLIPLPPFGDSIAHTLANRARFARAGTKGHTEFSGGVLTRHARKHDLPGPMAVMTPLRTDDGRGGKQGLLWNRRTGMLTAVLRCSPVGLELADQTQADQWVASWAAFLADLGHQPMIRWVSATLDTAPSRGESLADYVASRRSPHAPRAASEIMDEAAARTAGRTADISCYVAITFDPTRANPKPKDLLASVTEVTRWLPGLEQALSACGVTVLGRASVPWLVAHCAVAFDPALRGTINDNQHVLQWRDAAPLRTREYPDRYEHAAGITVSWAMRRPPQQAVQERTLRPLLSPGRYARRFTLLYDPLAADEAAQAVEREVTHLAVRREFSKRTKRDVTERELEDQRRAQQATREEARGAGVLDFVMYVSTTVTDPEALPAAIADTEQRAGQAKPLFRQTRHAQCAGFSAALGLGINPAELEVTRG